MKVDSLADDIAVVRPSFMNVYSCVVSSGILRISTMTSTKTNMLDPNHDFLRTVLQLGSIILDPKSPGESLNNVEIPVPSRHSSHKFNWEQTIGHTKDGRAGVWARCVHLLRLDKVETLAETLTSRQSITTDWKSRS
jgi:hypothetical protein